MRTIKGKFFIVPNAACLIAGNDPYPPGYISEMNGYVHGEFNIAVQVWMTSDECDNWDCHGGPLKAHCLPLRDLVSLKEGDTLIFLARNREGETCRFELTACQNDYRYRRFGKFEDTLYGVLRHNWNASWSKFERHVSKIYDALVAEAYYPSTQTIADRAIGKCHDSYIRALDRHAG
jgi:hypothetical protein